MGIWLIMIEAPMKMTAAAITLHICLRFGKITIGHFQISMPTLMINGNIAN